MIYMLQERIKQELSENKQLRAYIRERADCKGRPYPIVIVDGDSVPKRQGRRGVRVPKVYGQEFWTGRIGGYYARSSQRIEVGADWLLEELLTRNYLKVKNGKEKEN